MNIKSFDKIVNDRTNGYNDTTFNKNVARVIKNKRVDSNQTQSDVAKGICSISYISKIESGKCPPDNFYVREIMSKMGITLDEVMMKEFTKELYDIVEGVYYDDEHKISLLVELTENSDILSAKLVQLVGKAYLEDDISNLLAYINVYKADLTDYELKVYMYIIARYEASHLRYSKSVKYLMILNELDLMDPHLEFLITKLVAECNLYIGNYVESLYYINKADALLHNSYEILNLNKIRLLRVELLLYSDKPAIACKELEKFSRISSEQLSAKLNWLRGLSCLKKSNYTEAVNFFLNSQKYMFEDSILAVIMSLYQRGNVKKIEEYQKILSEGTLNSFYTKMAMYFKIKAEGNMYELRDFINKNLLVTFKKVQYKYYMDMVMTDLIRFHRMNSRYKAVDELRTKMSDKK